MSRQDSLDDIVGKAKGEAESLGQQNDNSSANKNESPAGKNANLIVLLIVVLVLLFVKVAIIDVKSRQLEENAAIAALQIFSEADAIIIDYFQQYRELPEEFVDDLYSYLVEYQKIDDDRYSIRVLVEPHDMVIEKSVGRNFSSQELEDLLNI